MGNQEKPEVTEVSVVPADEEAFLSVNGEDGSIDTPEAGEKSNSISMPNKAVQKDNSQKLEEKAVSVKKNTVIKEPVGFAQTKNSIPDKKEPIFFYLTVVAIILIIAIAMCYNYGLYTTSVIHSIGTNKEGIYDPLVVFTIQEDGDNLSANINKPSLLSPKLEEYFTEYQNLGKQSLSGEERYQQTAAIWFLIFKELRNSGSLSSKAALMCLHAMNQTESSNFFLQKIRPEIVQRLRESAPEESHQIKTLIERELNKKKFSKPEAK